MNKLTYAAEHSLRILNEAKRDLGKFNDVEREKPLVSSIDKIIDSLDILIRSGHFIEPEPKEGGHKI